MRSIIIITSFLLFLTSARSFAQCSTSGTPSFPSSCTSQFYTSITASGSGVTSTISYSGSSCTGSYYNLFSSQGVTAPTGSTVNLNISRDPTYFAYLLVYVDWNNNGTYETSELAGSVISLPAGTSSTTYSFTIPLTGIVTNTALHMRIFLGEPPSSGGPLSSINPPCSAKWGQANDYYLNNTCSTPTLSISPSSPVICNPGSTSLAASGAGGSATYSWSPGTGLSATTGATITASPTSTTTYTLAGYGPGVCYATTPVTITVNPGITAAITAGGATSFCRGGSVTLSETSGSGSTYQWYRGATLIAGATNSSYIASPTTTTTYSVLVTSATGCTDTASSTITIYPTPSATITPGSATTFCNGGSVTLTETSGSGTIYQWYAGSTAITGETNATYTAAPTATTAYSVVVTNTSGCRDTASVTVNILPLPTAVITPAGSTTACSPSTILLGANFAAGYTYRWFNVSGIISGATSQYYSAPTTGTYRVEVSTASGCRDTSAPQAVTVNPSPVATATASGPLTFCSSDSVTLSAVAGYTYQWLNGSVPVTGATNRTFTTRTPGIYDYRVMVTNGFGCSDTTASGLFHVVVNGTPVSTITASGSLTFCSGGSVVLSVPSVSGNTYQWYSGPTVASATAISGATTAAITVSTAGYYYVRVTTAAGCTSNSSATPLFINIVSIPAILHSTPLSFCRGGNVLLTLSTGTSTSGIIYQWKRNSTNISGATGSTYTATLSGVYTCFVNMSGGCVGTTAPVTVAANALPAPTITYNAGVLKVSITYASYQWYRNAVAIPGATTYKYTPHDTATYSVIVTDVNGCTSPRITYHLTSLGVENIEEAELPVIYPNPATNTVFVQCVQKVTIGITSMDGKTLIENKWSRETDISSLPAGLYIIKVTDESGRNLLLQKLIKQ